MQKVFFALGRFSFLIPLFLTIGLVPILVLPWFLDAYEVHKATLIIIASMFAGMLFLAKVMRDRAVGLHLSWTMIPLAAFFLSFFLSACFSLSPATSWLGLNGGDYASVLFVGACVLTSFLLAQASEHVRLLVRGMRFVWGITAFCMAVALVGIFFHILPIPTVLSFGVPHALALFFGVVTFLWLGEVSEGSGKCSTYIFGLFLLAALFTIAFFLDAWILWLPLFLGGVILLSLILAKSQESIRMIHVLPATFLIILSLVGWFLPHLTRGFFPGEIVPSFSLSLEIIRGVWEGGLRMLVGSGPGTYGISYAAHALPSVNATVFWNVLFERGFSYMFTLATTGGVFTFLAAIAVQCTGVIIGLRAWASALKEERGSILGLFLAFLFLSFSAWTYAWNTPLVFIMFVLFGLLLALGPHRKRSWSFASSAQASVFASFAFVSSLVVLSLVFFVAGTRYAAEIVYAQAIALDRQGADPQQVLVKVDQAASFNRWNDMYYRELSLLLLERINDLVTIQAPAEQIQSVLSAAVNAAVRATEIGPNTVANWEVRGNVYREVAPAVANAADFSIASFITATELAPNNPLYAVGLGRAYLAKADLFAQLSQSEDELIKNEALASRAAALLQAETALLRAVELKHDYTAARYFLSVVYEREDKLADAVKSMEIVRALNGEDVGVGMQLSLLYLRQGKNDLAKAELQRIIALSPTYANARWYLSVLFEQEGDIAAAILQVKEVLKTNPNNEAAQQRLVRLEGGEVEDDVAKLPDPLSEEALIEEGGDEGSVVAP